MTARITLISSGATRDVRNATFGGDAPLEAAERARAAALRPHLPPADRFLCGADSLSQQTAAALALQAMAEPVWGEVDFGRWNGKTLSAVQADEPDALAAWVLDPASAPHGGEPLTALIQRVGHWLDQQRDQHGRILIVAPANCLRAAILHCLRAPAEAVRFLDITPLTIIHLSGFGRDWRLRLGERPTES